jgi:hypothetical protein
MTSRERQLAVIRHKTPDRIPLDAIAIENQAAIARLLGIRADEVLDRLGLDGRIVSAAWATARSGSRAGNSHRREPRPSGWPARLPPPPAQHLQTRGTVVAKLGRFFLDRPPSVALDLEVGVCSLKQKQMSSQRKTKGAGAR